MRSYQRLFIGPSLEGITELFWLNARQPALEGRPAAPFALHYPRKAALAQFYAAFEPYKVVWPGDAQILVNLWDSDTQAWDIPFFQSRASVFKANWEEAFRRNAWHGWAGN